LFAHVGAPGVQQRWGGGGAPSDAPDADATRAAAGVLGFLYAGIRSAASFGGTRLSLQRCPKPKEKKDASVDDAMKDTPLVADFKKVLEAGGGGEVLKKVRETPSATSDEGKAIDTAIDSASADLSDDDKWLAKKMLEVVTDGGTGATTDSHTFTDPDPDPGTKTPIQTEVFFVPGQTARRAMVVGGVHGSEPAGAQVVEDLVTALKGATTKPYFTVILIPRLFDKSRQVKSTKSGNDAYRLIDDKIAKGAANVGSKGTKAAGNTEVEPNRNFPLPGKSYATYKSEGHIDFLDQTTGKARPPQDIVVKKTVGKGKDAKTKENAARAVASEHVLPENRILIHLLERFQPERLVTVHQKHIEDKQRGNGAGVFVDPRRPAGVLSGDLGFDPKADAALTPEGLADEKLTKAMLASVQTAAEKKNLRNTSLPDPLVGNDVELPGEKAKTPTVHYKTSAHSEGNSLGDYAPVEVKEGKADDRPAIGTITVEIPQYDTSDKAQKDALTEMKKIEVTTLQDIFLGDPSKVTP
jgi:hypothetical protein